MKNIQRCFFLLFAWLVAQQALAQGQPQTNVACKNLSSEVFYTGDLFVNYGSTSNAFNTKRRANVTVGLPAVGGSFNQKYIGNFGPWSRLLLAPAAPAVICSEGDLPDRVNIAWLPDPLSPAASLGFNIYRDGSLLASVDPDVRSYSDFNVIAGQFYTYTVAGKSPFGEGVKGTALGFLSPNGVVTGEVRTLSQNPVQDVLVTLSPTLGSAVAFGGSAKVFAEYDPLLNVPKWSASCWVKLGAGNDEAGILDHGSSISKNFWIHTTAAADGKGVKVGVGTGSGAETLQYIFPPAGADDWHHVAMTYNGMSLLLYVDGAFAGTKMVTGVRDSAQVFFGSKTGDTGFLYGKMDDVRLYDRQLSQTDIQMGMNRTVHSDDAGLLAYWKFDEGVGTKSFDISPNKLKAYLCGVSWTNDKPDVQNAGLTNSKGIFKIEGINYGSGTTFTAVADKKFYFNQSLEFNASNEQYADLTTFDLHDTATVTFTLKPFDLAGNQVILSKQGAGESDQFIASVNSGMLTIKIGSTQHIYGSLSAGFHHVAVMILQNGASVAAKVFVDGTQVGVEETFSGVDADFNNGTPWTLGMKRSGGSGTDFLTGLVDEAAFFNKNLSLSDIQTYANIGTDITNAALKNFFNLNEGIGDSLQDLGMALSGRGVRSGATWSVSAAIVQTLPHIFTPSSRLVTLTPSNTSTDGVQFTDQSLVPVSGFVRYDGTDCFVEGAEILGDGFHFAPPVFTDKDGKFICELEPGATVKLSATYSTHTISLPFWEIRNIASPVAGILFRDVTKREVSGQIAGGLCRKSIIPDGAIVKVKVSSLDGCFEKVITLNHEDDENGKFRFANLPPKKMVVALIEHSNSVIYNYFQIKGATVVDLTDSNHVVDFIYFAPPQVETSALDTNMCGQNMLLQGENYSLDIKVFQEYDGGRCYLQDAKLAINNDISDANGQFDTTMTGGKLKYKFKAGLPELTDPYLKSLSILAEADSQSTTQTLLSVVTGKRPRSVNFTSKSPEVPFLVLHDPPGDGSSSRMEKGTQFCFGMNIGGFISKETGKEVTVNLGPDTEIATGVGVEKTTEIESTNDNILSGSVTYKGSAQASAEICITTNQTIQTNDDEVIVGDDADLYMGAAINFLYGVTDELEFVKDSCKYRIKKTLQTQPGEFATTFIYSEYQIKNVIIPSLKFTGENAAAKQWEDILKKNKETKDKAIFDKNISFDAGVIYDESRTLDINDAAEISFEFEISTSVANETGLVVDGIGGKTKIEQSFSWGLNVNKFFTNSNSKTTGYTLADNDIGDYFTVDIKKDGVYGTPVFTTKSGASSCPYETTTVPREQVALAINKQVIANVPMNDPAVFTFTLGNISQTGETREYLFGLIPESNTKGAIVKVQGGGATDRPFGLPYSQGQEVTVTVERGPVEFDYTDLEFAIYSECEDARGVALGLDTISAKFYQKFLVDVYFQEPCSRVDIGFPLQNWVLTPADGSVLFVTLNSYDVGDGDLELIRVQYRRKQGDGAWINIVEVPKAQLGPVFEIIQWNTAGLADGEYEIRAVAQCFGGLNPGISHVIQGRIERTPPEIFGTPQPSSGILTRDGEISIQFTEPIRCDLLIAADFFNNNNVGLYDTETGELIDAIITCQGDKIIIVPNVPNRFIENKVLRVEIDNIKDLAANNFSHAEWEFFVDRNPIRWDGGNVKVTKRKPEFVTVTRRILNDGGQATAFTIEGIPAWVRVYPSVGVIPPGASELITFEFDSTLVFGQYLDTIFIDAPEGREPLIVNCRVLCESPDWVFSPAAFPHTMNFSLQLDIEGQLSTDEEDIVAAFIDGELRGLGKLQLLPTLPPLGTQYRVFMTVYGNDTDDSKPVKFEIWDASACLRYGEVIEQFQFEVDNVIGTVGSPTVLHTNSMVRRDIPLTTGWNWISFNLLQPNQALNSALASLQHPQNDLLKSQTAFSEYFGGNWVGSLAAVNNTGMFQYRADQTDTIQMRGALIDPATVNIPVTAGWNWIGYVPNYALPVSDALAGLTPLNGDIIKGQTAFAQYIAGFGWLGSLQFMEPPMGYQLKISNPGTITYPANFTDNPAQARGETAPTAPLHWTVDPTRFEHTMTVVGMLAAGGQNATLESHEVGFFAGNELRGSAQAIYIEPLDAYLFFLTVYANTSGEQLQFKLFDVAGNTVSDLAETLFFAANQHSGSVLSPMPFTLQTTGVAETPAEIFLSVRPNPFSDATTILFGAEQAREARLVITDVMGRLVLQQDIVAVPGLNTIRWDAGSISAGVYFIRVETAEGIAVRKIVKE